MKRKILGLVLAGGKSKRFGQDKASYVFHDGICQLDYAMHLLDTFCERTVVSVGDSRTRFGLEESNHDWIEDVPGMQGPIGGVMSGLVEAQGKGLLVVACDMPLLEGSLILRLLTQRDVCRLATCYLATDGKPEPLCAIYEPGCLPLLEKATEEGQMSLRRFLTIENVARVPCRSPKLLASLNTQADVDRLRSIVS
ncbi:MAG: molybdenum cofactor guanylyltransferase [Opitutales bacterium]|nr:molybdenum cofactor guanylyltransferase [Opitutales bacterium]MCH2615219.1 molybdenum cofactor guanylyltransferase [Opitutales bacterium]